MRKRTHNLADTPAHVTDEIFTPDRTLARPKATKNEGGHRPRSRLRNGGGEKARRGQSSESAVAFNREDQQHLERWHDTKRIACRPTPTRL